MTFPQLHPDELERDRLREAEELAADGPGWADGYRPGTFGCHELLDRTALLAELLERQLMTHPACVANAEWYRLAGQAAAALHELYQRVGAAHLSEEGTAAQEATG
jgi:hypothetical protein